MQATRGSLRLANKLMEHHTYLGDGVYAEYTEFGVNLRLGDHRSMVVVVLEPEVMQQLFEWYKIEQEAARLASEAEADESK